MWSLRSSDAQHLARRVYRRYLDGCTQLLREVRTEEELDFDIETLPRLLLGVLDGLMRQWLSLDDSPEGFLAEEPVRMLQSALPTMKYEPGLAPGGSSSSMSDLNQIADEDYRTVSSGPTGFTCSGPNLM